MVDDGGGSRSRSSCRGSKALALGALLLPLAAGGNAAGAVNAAEATRAI